MSTAAGGPTQLVSVGAAWGDGAAVERTALYLPLNTYTVYPRATSRAGYTMRGASAFASPDQSRSGTATQSLPGPSMSPRHGTRAQLLALTPRCRGL
eukprot:gene31030-7121_t